MSTRKKPGQRFALISKLRKPTAPPMRVAEDETKYSRKREHERTQRERKTNHNG